MAPVYDQNEALNTLWNEIMNVHWKFLDADESMEKIELRRRLEGKCFYSEVTFSQFSTAGHHNHEVVYSFTT